MTEVLFARLDDIDISALPGVTITSPTDGQVLTYDSGTGEWVNEDSAAGVSSFTDLDDVPASYATHGSKLVRVNAGATALEFVDGTTVFQPLDADLTAIAALATTSFGRGLLVLADEDALEALLDTLPNLTSIQGRTVTLADAGANAIFGWDDTAGAYENLTGAEAFAVVKAGADAVYQPLDSDLTSWAAITRAAGFDTFVASPTAANFASLVTGESYGLADAELAALAGLTSAADKLPYFTGSGTAALADLSANMRTFMTTPSAANFATLVSDDVFALSDVELGAIAGLVSAADRLPYFTGSGTASLATFTATGRSIVDDASVLAVGQTLFGADPAADRIIFFDDSADAFTYLTAGNGLTITTTTIAVDSATQSVDGIVELATAAEYWTGTDAARVPAIDQIWAAAGIVTLTDAATIAVAFSTGINFNVVLAGNRTLGNPTAEKVGQTGVILVTATTSTRTLTLENGATSEWRPATGVEAFPISVTTTETVMISYWVQSTTITWITGVFRRTTA